jgi:two-component system cell cycle response regulator CpdR
MARILLAEDDDSLRGFLARALERAGFEVTACADGEEAVQHLDTPGTCC